MRTYEMNERAAKATEYLRDSSEHSIFVKSSAPHRSGIESRGNVLVMRNKFREQIDIERGAKLIIDKGRG